MRPVAYAYTPSGRSPAQSAATGFGVLGWRRRNLPPMAPRVFVAPATGLGLAPAPRAVAPVAFAAFRVAMLRRLNTTSSPRGELRRACGEPRRRVSLSSALDPSRRFLRIPIWCASSAPFCAASPSAEPLSVWRERGAGSAASEDARVCRRRRCHARSQWYQQRHGRLNQVYCLGKDAQTRATETERTASRTEAKRTCAQQSAKESFGARLDGARVALGWLKRARPLERWRAQVKNRETPVV